MKLVRGLLWYLPYRNRATFRPFLGRRAYPPLWATHR